MNALLGMVTIDCVDPAALARFWTRALGVEVAADYGEFVMLTSQEGTGVRVGLQRVEQPTAGKNSVHLDLSTDDRGKEVARLVELGARELAEHEVPGLRWTVLADPAGNQFCVGSHHD